MSKKQQSTQQPSKKVGRREERASNKPSRPITPTPADTPPPAQPAPAPEQPAPAPEQPSKPDKT